MAERVKQLPGISRARSISPDRPRIIAYRYSAVAHLDHYSPFVRVRSDDRVAILNLGDTLQFCHLFIAEDDVVITSAPRRRASAILASFTSA